MKKHFAIELLSLCFIIFGCHSTSKPKPTVNTFAGEYLFQMGDSGATYHDPDRLIVGADGHYILIHMPHGHPGSKEEGTWKLWSYEGQPELSFDFGTYPAEIHGRHIRLVINDDLGYWYEKVK